MKHKLPSLRRKPRWQQIAACGRHAFRAAMLATVLTTQVAAGANATNLEISIRPGSEAGGLNVRSPHCPDDVIDFRTCEGVIVGSQDLGLFQVKLPVTFGDGQKSWRREGNTWSYSWPYAQGITVRIAVEPESDSLKLSYTLQNTTTNALEKVQLHTCIPTTEAPAFFPPPAVVAGATNWSELYQRLHLWSADRPFTFADTLLSATESHLSLMQEGAAPVRWAWWVNGPETFDLPLIALRSRDGQTTIALGFEQAIWASANTGDERACFHLFPWFGRIEPGRSTTVRGRLYVLRGGARQARVRFERDFPLITAQYALVSRIGPAQLYAPPVERYRLGAPDLNNPAYYPIPKTAVTRDTYMTWLEESGLLEHAKQPELGSGGPTLLLPALAKYVQTGERHWGEACIAMLKDYRRGLEREVQEKGWTEQFAEPPAFLPVYRKYLIAGGLMTAEEPWFRELWLYYCRNLHVWNSEPVEWRGPCHRSMPEALAKGLAAKWYPDIPEASRWQRYSEQVWEDLWRVKDLLQNDTGYFQDATRAYAFSSEGLLGDDRYLADPGMQHIWQRLMAEITPDGAINPYGPNGGWNSTAALRVGVLERVATATRDGAYRFAAHKAMNYLLYQTEPTLRDSYLLNQETAPYVVLAWLTADDTLPPSTPPDGGLVTRRREYARIPHRDKTIVGKYLPDLDPDPDMANLCCNQAFTERTVPDKLVLRSGWNPGDFFVLVDLVPTSFPFNAGGILGMNRWGAPFTQVVTSKGDIPENRLAITDLSGAAPRRYMPDPDRISEEWQQGKMPDIMTTVPFFRDTPQVTLARVEVQNPEGLPVKVIQEYVFVKNRFLTRRETVVFEESFPARIAALWNTQNIGPQIGSHWANTFMTAPVASNRRITMNTPPADLLIWFAPQPGWHLQVVDRTAEDPRTQVTPGQLRYIWEGTPEEGASRHMTQVYYPHAATRARASSVEPGARAVYDAGNLAATAGAAGIQVIRDEVNLTLLRFEFEPGRVEWVAFNPSGGTIRAEGTETNEPLLYQASSRRDKTE